jgi:outer membrane biosynthesis protein TonB
MLGWLPSKPELPGSPTSMASPGQQVAGSAPDVALLPGETLVAPPEAPPPSAKPVPPALAKRAPQIPPSVAPSPPLVPRKAPSVYTQPAPPPSSATASAETPAPRAAPARPNYTSDELARQTAYERSTRNVCINCGAVTSIGSAGPDWEVRVHFDDGSNETLRYPERPSLRIGDRVHLEDGRLLRD